MADDAGHTRADLTQPPPSAEDIAEMDFFELLRQLETEERRFGRSGTAAREPARLGQSARMSFATSDLAAYQPARGDAPARVTVNLLGLIGPEGPMPLHMTRWILQRLSNRWFSGESEGVTSDTSFLEFANLLQHRLMTLYWRAWADTRPEIHIAHGDGARVTALLGALAGIGLPGQMTGDQRLDGSKLHHATSLAQEVRSPERLARFLETVLEVPVTIEEFAGHWIEIPVPLQSRLGQSYSGLGTGAVVGARSYDRQSRAEIGLGPLTLAQVTAFLDDAEAWDRLRHAVIFAMGRDIAFGLRLVLRADEVPEARLGQGRLGQTLWLDPRPGHDPDDLCFASLTETPRAAAGGLQ
ncbi:type VI secretion system baseplate subunit TssG [Pseudooceanicola sp. 502str34]